MRPNTSRATYACVPCHEAWKEKPVCPRCGAAATYMGRRWRAPKKRNRLGWRRVAAGEVLWDRRAVAGRLYPHPRTAYHRNVLPVRLVKGRHVRGDVRLKDGVVSK